jgi:hypothetical protein
VLVEDNSAGSGSGRVNVRIPLKLLSAGVRLTSLLPPPAIARLNAEMGKAGVPVDLAGLKPQQLEELLEHLDDFTIDVDDPASRVQIFCE